MRLLGNTPTQQIAITDTFESKFRTTLHPDNLSESRLRCCLHTRIVDTRTLIGSCTHQIDTLVQILLTAGTQLILSLHIGHQDLRIAQIGITVIRNITIGIVILPIILDKFPQHQTIISRVLVGCLGIIVQHHLSWSHFIDPVSIGTRIVFVSQCNVIRILFGEGSIQFRCLILGIVGRILRFEGLDRHRQTRITISKRILRIVQRRLVNRLTIRTGIRTEQFQRGALVRITAQLTNDIILDTTKQTKSRFQTQVTLEIEHQFGRTIRLEQFSIILMQGIYTWIHDFSRSINRLLPVTCTQCKTGLESQSCATGRALLTHIRSRQQTGGLVQTFVSISQYFTFGRTGGLISLLQSHALIQHDIAPVGSQFTVGKPQHEIGFPHVLINLGFTYTGRRTLFQSINHFRGTCNAFIKCRPSSRDSSRLGCHRSQRNLIRTVTVQ